MNGWPSTWLPVKGADVFSVVTSGSRGWAQHYASSGASFIRVGNLDHDTTALDLVDVQRVRPPVGAEGERTRLQPDDLLVSITAEVGMVGLVPSSLGEAYINQHIALARPVPGPEPRFLAWYLASEADGKRQLLGASRGGTKSGLGLDDIRQVKIPLAPLAEQQRIADKLDAVTARVDACRDRLARVAPLLKRFRQSVLAAATSGELTMDWRRSSANRTTRFRFDELVSDSLVGLVRPASEQSYLSAGLVPYLKMNNISEHWGYSLNGLVGVRCDSQELFRYQLAPGDWLFNTRNSVELVGKSCVWKGGTVVFNNNILRVRFNDLANPDFIEVWFRSPVGRAALSVVKSATTSVAAIYQKSLFALELDLPPIEEQAEIVHRVDTLFAFADRLEARLAKAQAAADRLTPALLAKAFRGELVPQDPADEPAAVLLQRLAASRPAPAGKTRRPRAGQGGGAVSAA